MAYFQMELVVFSSLNMILTLGISLAYRYGQTGAGVFSKMFTNPKLFVIGSVVVFVSFHLAGTGSLIYSRVNMTEFEEATLKEFPNPVLKEIFDTEVIFGYSPKLNPTIVHFVQNGVFGACVGIPAIILFNLLQVRVIRRDIPRHRLNIRASLGAL